MAQQQHNSKRDSTKPVWYKSIEAKGLTVDESSRKISGYAAIWGNIDDAGDILVKGCCARSIDARGPASATNRKIIFLWMHDADEPMGRITMLKEDEKGLYFECEVDKIPEGDRALEQLKSGTLNQFSIGYMYVWDKCEWTEVPDPTQAGKMVYVLVVKEINLFEISVVSLGCNEETSFEGLKGVQIESERNKLMRDTEKALKEFSYETQLTIKQLISKHIALAQVDPAPPLDKNDPPAKNTVDYKTLLTAFKTN